MALDPRAGISYIKDGKVVQSDAPLTTNIPSVDANPYQQKLESIYANIRNSSDSSGVMSAAMSAMSLLRPDLYAAVTALPPEKQQLAVLQFANAVRNGGDAAAGLAAAQAVVDAPKAEAAKAAANNSTNVAGVDAAKAAAARSGDGGMGGDGATSSTSNPGNIGTIGAIGSTALGALGTAGQIGLGMIANAMSTPNTQAQQDAISVVDMGPTSLGASAMGGTTGPGAASGIGVGSTSGINGMDAASDAASAAASSSSGHGGTTGSDTGDDGSSSGDSSGDGTGSGGDGPGSDGGSSGGDGGGSAGGDGGGDGGWAKGGRVTKDRLRGPNPKGPDDGYGALDHGEYVITGAAGKRLGADKLKALNEGRADIVIRK